jgi:hypothetical protein
LYRSPIALRGERDGADSGHTSVAGMCNS